MTHELWCIADPAQTVAAELRGADRTQVWNGTALVPLASLDDAGWQAGLLPLAESCSGDDTGSGVYVGSMPGGLAVGEYALRYFLGPSPNPGDEPLALQVIAWEGDAEETLPAAVADVIAGLGGSYPTVAQIAAAILSDPAAPIQVDAQGFVCFFYNPQPQIVYTMPANLACSRADVENVFGAQNVQKWADVDNCGDPTVIARRIDWSIAWATNELQDMLRDGPYVVDPLPVTAAATWVPLAAMLAGWMLSNPRVGEDTVDPAVQRKNSWALKHVQETVHEIKTGLRRINAVPARRMANVPMVMP
jgi:hypothetical protein